MTNVAILGASGQIAQHVVAMLGERDDINQTLVARNAAKLRSIPSNATVVEGDVMDPAVLTAAITGQDMVYANLSGNVDEQAPAIIAAMTSAGVQRLIFITTLGILDEVPGAFGVWNTQMIGGIVGPYRIASDAIEAADLDSTIIRPAWLTDGEEIDYEITQRDEPFKGTEVSRRSVAALVVDLIENPEKQVGANIGINRPGTDGDKPAFMSGY